MNFEFTQLSYEEFNHIKNNGMSDREVFLHITDGLNIRTFSETLLSLSGGRKLSEELTARLCEYSPEVKPDSIARKVRDWYGGKYEPSEREDFFRICFALGLGETEADAFLSIASDGGFHLRNPRELALAYSLRTGKSYPEAIELFGRLKPLPPGAGSGSALTKSVASAFGEVYDDESFFKFYEESYDDLGILHNTAYLRFTEFLDLLIMPETPLYSQQDGAYSTERVVEEYLRMNVPLDKNTSGYTILQKTIKKFWPNTTNIIRMKNRSVDVSRRALLLLYLVTEGAVRDENDEYLLDEDLTAAERFEEHYWRLDSMLVDCGMSLLDPRNVFDWLVLYSLKTDEDDAMSERLQAVLNRIFND